MTIKKPILRQRKTKIVATLGPASSTHQVIRDLFVAGVDVFRLNFSHGKHEDHAERIQTIRAIETEMGRPIAILADLQGPKLRIGTFANGPIHISSGQHFTLDQNPEPGDETRVCLPHPEIIFAVNVGDDLLLDDGKVRLRIIKKNADALETEVVNGALLSDRKGVNVPGAILPIPALTEKDRRDLDFALSQGVDWVALSFVQRPEDMLEARALVGDRAALLAKIEKPSAVQMLDAIVAVSDGIMLARGDLGVECPPEDVPAIQKHVVRSVRAAGKPLIIATQMLESMIYSAAPTRAEASDVATAVYDGADAVMLSAETASGQYPIESVSMMNRIACKVEGDTLYRTIVDAARPVLEHTAPDAITHAAREAVDTVKAAAIVTCTTGGSTALRAARERPPVPILCLTDNMNTARRLSLSYAVHADYAPDIVAFEGMIERACALAVEDGLAVAGQKLVITAGIPFGVPGSTNVLQIVKI